MAITIQLPPNLEEELRRQDPQLDEKAREQFLIASYQAGKLSTGDIALTLGLETRFEAEQWLARHGVHQNYSLEDLEADQRAFDRLLGPMDR